MSLCVCRSSWLIKSSSESEPGRRRRALAILQDDDEEEEEEEEELVPSLLQEEPVPVACRRSCASRFISCRRRSYILSGPLSPESSSQTMSQRTGTKLNHESNYVSEDGD
ncbi:unnamed protein product [Pleuronectes platessa]|uniref:Uncharacterized protein n=1 Tax=Pleuronectes platessa TaxID=8262 RepID=A0A9N7Z8F3_PLEPL|nr:unnamed protein product [Pleuronectes platessa]